MAERAVILSDNSSLRTDDFIFAQSTKGQKILSDEELNLETLERKAIEKAIKVTNGNYTMAAELLGISRLELHYGCRTFRYKQIRSLQENRQTTTLIHQVWEDLKYTY